MSALALAFGTHFCGWTNPPLCCYDPDTGGTEMGAKQSAVGSAVLSQSPTLEHIREAYGQGEERKAQELIRIACHENGGGQVDSVRQNHIKLSWQLWICIVLPQL